MRTPSAQLVPQPVSCPGNEQRSGSVPSQAPPQVEPSLAHDRAPCGLPATVSHVPGFAPSQASHVPVQARSQQTPSAHAPLAQSAFAAHARPIFFLQEPVASHVRSPVHELGSSAPSIATHSPVPAAHDWQVAVHALTQHTP